MDATRLLSILILICLFPASRLASGQEGSRFETGPKFESRSPQFRQRTTAPQRNVSRTSQRTPATDVRVQYHAKPDLFIPFDLSAHADSVSEVRLYKSEQSGRDWALYQTQSPRAKGFQFQAPRDGEYWFAVRTTDANRRQTTANPTAPELRLVVDTQKPQLDVRMNGDGQGNIAADWIVEDTNLAAHTFTIRFQDERGQWRRLDVETPEPNDPRQRWRGSARFAVPATSREIDVVVEVMDNAENLVRDQQIVTVDGSRPTRQVSNQRSSQRPGSRFENEPGLRSAVPERRETETGRGWQNLFGGVQHANNATHGASRQQTRPRFSAERSNEPLSRNTTNSRSSFSRVSASGARQTAADPRSTNPRRDIETNRTAYVNQSFYPPGERPRITSSPRFEIDYELQGLGQRGAKRVELWVTRDGGRNWELYGADRDARSPMEVNLTNEGMYGFRLTVQGYNSPNPPAPQENEPADIWVAADWEKPTGRITQAILRDQDTSQPYAGNGRELVINYVAEDALLERRPISINYGASPDGPWYPIIEATENSGSYTLKLDRRLPEQLFLELQIRDIAGNVTSSIFNASNATSTGRPAVRIRGIRPTGRSASQSNTQSPYDARFNR